MLFRSIVGPLLAQMMEQMGAVFGDSASESIGMDMIGFIMELPLPSVMHFQDAMLPASPEVLTADMLRQAHALP